ncbi:Hypothetical predicted protein [Mytilus galloprovincialis]|uniref:MAGUK p55 subfamily member 6 n=1 Tax=Mytilus galloprovincialis TaxID=29158 RepID=A0A8B6DCW7_MYTGA|nr:Hypothetical predicted protein [Mytilus galloprovincialis]
MPAATTDSQETAIDCLHDLRSQLDDIGDRTGARDADLDFLKSFLTDPVVQKIAQADDELKLPMSNPPSDVRGEKLLADVNNVIQKVVGTANGRDLDEILSDPHIGALMKAYDDVADKNYEEELYETNKLAQPPPPVFSAVADHVRLVSIKKDKTTSLGITVKIDENFNLRIARVLAGSVIDKQGMLHVNDIIKEVNGIPVATPEQLMDIIRVAESEITFKIIPTMQDINFKTQMFMKAHFNYDPLKDRLIPSKDAGLTFSDGDILHILTSEDPNWWQARRVVKDGEGPTGLIPSQQLEEKRKAFVQPDYDYSKSSLLCGLKRRKKKKINYTSSKHKEFDKCEITIYEEVTKMPPFQRKTLVLVGASGVGRRALKQKLLKDDPRRFGAVMPHTSRAPREGEVHGKGYYFTDREGMDEEIREGKYIEWGEFNGNLYGTKLESIHNVTMDGKMCVLDVSPTSLKVLKTAEYMPFVVFIAAPGIEALKRMYEEGRRRGLVGRKGASGHGTIEVKTEHDFYETIQESQNIERVYKGMFDFTIVNDDFDETYRTLRRELDNLSSEQQWVPINWVY